MVNRPHPWSDRITRRGIVQHKVLYVRLKGTVAPRQDHSPARLSVGHYTFHYSATAFESDFIEDKAAKVNPWGWLLTERLCRASNTHQPRSKLTSGIGRGELHAVP